MDLAKEKLRRRFPSLSDEVDDGVMSIPLNQTVEEEGTPKADHVTTESAQKKSVKSLDGYDPTVVDFIRRCGSENEAREIIDYMERKGEIGRSEAQRMRSQLRTKGLRSFGAKKEYGYYLNSLD